MIRALVALVALALLGCDGTGAPGDCSENLAGVWRDDDGRRYHVVDQRSAIEIYALADSRENLDRPMPGATRSASYARLRRIDGALAGHGQQFRTRGARACRVRWTITGNCAGALALELGDPGDLDYSDCSQKPDLGPRALVLHRVN